MPINFPDAPSSGDTHTVGDKTWTYDGTAWNLVTSSASDHGNLGGLGDDDHTQYALADGTRGTFEASGAVSTHEATSDPHTQYLLADGSRTATELTVTNTLSVDTDTLHVNSTNNRVGIGTTTPAGKLHVEFDSGSDGVVLTNTANTVGKQGMRVAFDNDRLTVQRTSDSGVFEANYVAIDQDSGNVGIGTTSPDVPLHVDGDAGNHEIAKLQSSQTSATYSLVGITDANETAKAFIGFNPGASLNNTNSYLMLGMNGDDVNGGTGLIVRKGGNVGIGTTGPTHKLHVDAGASGGIRIETDNDSVINFRTRNNARAWNVGNYFTTWNGLASPFIIQPTENSGTSDISITPVTNSPGSGLIIKADGRVCVGGDTNPAAHFTVKAAGTGNNDGLVEFHSWTGSASSPTEVEDWPTPVLALRAYDDFFAQQMLSFGYSNDPVYQTGGNVWSFRLESGYGATSSSSSTNLNLLGPGTFKVGNFNATGVKTFRISHPLPELNETHDLLHNVVESPQADNLYRGSVSLVDGLAVVNLDEAAGMTEGTFVLLNRDIQCFTSNENGWTNIRGSVDGNVLTIEAQDSNCTDTVSWMVIGERQDNEIKASPDTDENGHLIVEPLTNRVSEAAIAESIARMEAAKAAQSAP